MGGKSRKSGGISYNLVYKLKSMSLNKDNNNSVKTNKGGNNKKTIIDKDYSEGLFGDIGEVEDYT
jgi:hypothetical protein